MAWILLCNLPFPSHFHQHITSSQVLLFQDTLGHQPSLYDCILNTLRWWCWLWFIRPKFIRSKSSAVYVRPWFDPSPYQPTPFPLSRSSPSWGRILQTRVRACGCTNVCALHFGSFSPPHHFLMSLLLRELQSKEIKIFTIPVLFMVYQQGEHTQGWVSFWGHKELNLNDINQTATLDGFY